MRIATKRPARSSAPERYRREVEPQRTRSTTCCGSGGGRGRSAPRARALRRARHSAHRVRPRDPRDAAPFGTPIATAASSGAPTTTIAACTWVRRGPVGRPGTLSQPLNARSRVAQAPHGSQSRGPCRPPKAHWHANPSCPVCGIAHDQVREHSRRRVERSGGQARGGCWVQSCERDSGSSSGSTRIRSTLDKRTPRLIVFTIPASESILSGP